MTHTEDEFDRKFLRDLLAEGISEPIARALLAVANREMPWQALTKEQCDAWQRFFLRQVVREKFEEWVASGKLVRTSEGVLPARLVN